LEIPVERAICPLAVRNSSNDFSASPVVLYSTPALNDHLATFGVLVRKTKRQPPKATDVPRRKASVQAVLLKKGA